MLDVNLLSRPVDNPGYRRMFRPGELTAGIFIPVEAYPHDRPTMEKHLEMARRAESGGFAALWVRDIPLRVPTFGDVGQVFDPWVYLGYLAAGTSDIALATGAIVLPLRHPLHTAKAAASVDRLSGGRLVFGVAAGDRPVEFPAFNVNMDERAEAFREHLRVLRVVLTESYPQLQSSYGTLQQTDLIQADLIPKPVARGIPTMVTGRCLQDLEWIVRHSDGWVSFARKPDATEEPAHIWRACAEKIRPGEFLPYAQPLYIDLDADPHCPPSPIHLGFRIGRAALIDHLHRLHAIGVNHVVFNIKYCRRPAAEVMEELIELVLPQCCLRAC